MNNYFFVSDTHFSHAKALDYNNRRRWAGDHIDQMNEEMIRRWNATVGPGDIVYHCGDFAFCKPEEAGRIAGRLNGRKHIVFGNHDKHLRGQRDFERHFQILGDLKTIKVPDTDVEGGNQLIVLCHYPLKVWDRSHYRSLQLHGHSHGTLPEDLHSLQMDVGVDCHEGYPISYEDVKRRMSKKLWRPADGHGRR